MDALALLLVLAATPDAPEPNDHWLEAAGLKLQLAEPESPAPALLPREPLPSVPVEAQPEPKPEPAPAPPQETAIKNPKASYDLQQVVLLVAITSGVTAGFAVGLPVQSAMVAQSPNSNSQQVAGALLALAVAVPVGFVAFCLGGAIARGIIGAATGEDAFPW